MDLLALFSLNQVEQWFEWGGYFILFGLLFACGLGLPLPEDIPLLLGGYFVALGQMHLVWVAVLAWLGIMGGDCVLYRFGRKYGLNITKVPFIGKHVTKERILWAEKKFEKYGVGVVMVCRLFAGVRGAMVIAAGVVRFNFVKFVIADGIAALLQTRCTALNASSVMSRSDSTDSSDDTSVTTPMTASPHCACSSSTVPLSNGSSMSARTTLICSARNRSPSARPMPPPPPVTTATFPPRSCTESTVTQ